MNEEGDYLVFRSGERYDYHSKVCLAMQIGVKTSPEEMFHVVVERCRYVLFTFPGEVLVSPQPQSDHFLMLCDPAFPQTEKFQQLAGKICVVEAWSCPVSSQVLGECLAYTLSARLAPEWNRVGGWLLQGRKFLHHAQPLNAVKIKVNVAQERLEVCVKATRVSFPLITPEDLGISEDLLETFIEADESFVLTERDFGKRTLHVLPKLSRAKLISISKRIPPSSKARVNNWALMKSYWKNMYGYRLGLDETDAPKVYYNVSFWNGPTLTYPEWTVRLAEPRPVPRTDPKPILDGFIKDLLAFNKELLGLPFCLDPVPLVPQVTGLRPRYGMEETALSSLCSQAGWPAPSVPYRKEDQQRPRLHSEVWRTEPSQAAGSGGGRVSSVNFTGDQGRKAETSVDQQGRTVAGTQDSGYSTSGNLTGTTSTSTTLPMMADRMKPSFMMKITTKDQKNQFKPYQPKTKLTRKLKPNYDPFAFEKNPEIRASLAQPQTEPEVQRTLSQKVASLLDTKKEKKSSKIDEDIMTF